ncbi:MAG TPA: class IV adenylate cyclase [Patescibacteria group bacterium]|nr:class IV adenylate cyclase [Patescibacteria group bacterium]
MEIEIKLPVIQPAMARRRLRRLGAKTLGRVHERNTLFDTPANALKRSGRLLRVRSIEKAGPPGRGRARSRAGTAGPGARSITGLLTYKGPAKAPAGAGRYKVREEVEVEIVRPEAAERILIELGFRPSFRYEKYRTSFRLPGLPLLAVELDETPIGAFFELEGPKASIDRAARWLGYRPRDYLTASYYELFLPERRRLGLDAGAMLFPASTKSISPLFS